MGSPVWDVGLVFVEGLRGCWIERIWRKIFEQLVAKGLDAAGIGWRSGSGLRCD